MSDQPADAQTKSPYRVLARKYRPGAFADLIGQEALVRTLTNAIETGRVPHAFVLTGVRGVGKTTTARIIAKALNYKGPDGTSGPTTGDTSDCPLCQAIAEDRHPDVIEMDAASRTGVDDIRELIEGVRYRPTEARYKVYIIDEVHMLSKNAFNALLKTLEEPPEHVIFIFATTEIRKVPVTVLSRCQRFDLRRVDQEELRDHFARICEMEEAEADTDALSMIARAADGSVRDGLSLLDQAIALSSGKVEVEQVKTMLGLADRARVYDLLEAVLGGKIAEALEIMTELYQVGADPLVVLQDLLELTHGLTRLKVVPGAAELPGLAETERVRGKEMADTLTMAAITRAWQLLLKGVGEVQLAPRPLQAAEMVLIRLAYASDLPSPADLIKQLQDAPTGEAGPSSSTRPSGNGGSNGGGRNGEAAGSGNAVAQSNVSSGESAGPRMSSQPASRPAAQSAPQPQTMPGQEPQPQSFEALVALVEEAREPRLAKTLRDDVQLVSFKPGRLELFPLEQAPKDLAGKLTTLLQSATGARWTVAYSNSGGGATLREQRDQQDAEQRAEVMRHPLVDAVLKSFPGAEIQRVSEPAEPEMPDDMENVIPLTEDEEP